MRHFYRIAIFIIVFFGFGTLVTAQTLAEVQVVTAIATELNPAIRLPSGSYRAVGEGTDEIISKVNNASGFTNWEVYTASGLLAALQPAFVQQLSTSFAGAGYFITEQDEQTIGIEKHTRYIFEDGLDKILLYTIRTNKELIWLVAKGS